MVGCLRGLPQFRDELATIETKRTYSHPPALDTDVASFDVTLSDAGLPLCPSALDALGAKVVWLKFHIKAYHKSGAISAGDFFSENKSWCAYS
jgi:hypothetical protein